MLRQLHKFLFIICLFVAFFFCPTVTAQNNAKALENVTAEQINFNQQDVKVNDLDIEPINTQEVKKEIVPDTKSESKKVFKYFLKTMFGVMFCAIILYLILLFVKKYYGSAFMYQQEEDEFEAFDLSTPNTKQDSLKSFLNRTK